MHGSPEINAQINSESDQIYADAEQTSCLFVSGAFFLFFFFLLPLSKLTALSIKVNFKLILLKRCIKCYYHYQTPSASALYGGFKCLLEAESTNNLTK